VGKAIKQAEVRLQPHPVQSYKWYRNTPQISSPAVLWPYFRATKDFCNFLQDLYTLSPLT
jgi:hypothetical protein